jgi:DNA-binding beta-propeller fold protein YncE
VRFIREPISGTLRVGGVVVNALALSGPDAPQAADAVDALGLDGATDVKVSPNGQYVFATGRNSDALSVFGRNSSNGILSSVQVITRGTGLPALDGAREIDVSADGTSVYVTGSNDNAVTALHAANPVPTLSNLLPASAQQGGPGLLLKVQGTNFVPGAAAKVGGSDRATA